ncbi:hypothetical protein [Streptomyces clavuligerus]|uniref:hypothetical protein n=1 Tax=Streptomyces clavuligerus TaxID=1901 RepID=UPI001013D62F|nr:hypothetical protein [Streptomyces clavuligerus]MBY6301254.1 hypothetical protein [Streptomyces clavuligerus]QPJ96303.1 hypothetical protein GE265_26775 [Streptomyces clavuligerus]QPL61566.1 hypothetical protein I3J04_00995 [Streptomyces clavuligerus]QPL67605.1 hypothetical protein I3J05_01010 [Streptomyces clavuligerus]QPL73675.1 hypothetical protein I3J06_01005 [Streptomyces clavuligerus]
MPLVTGDTAVVTGTGGVARVEPGPGRKGAPVRITRRRDRTFAVPVDARRLIREGRLGERLFDSTEPSRPEYRERNGHGLIVRHRGRPPRPARRSTGPPGPNGRGGSSPG